MAPWPLLILAGVLTGFEVEQDGVVIRVEVTGIEYAWTVESRSSAPITGFAIDVYHCYNYMVPEDWSFDGPTPTGTFRAWTDEPRQAILPGRSATFSTRLNNRGAMLGVGPATIQLVDGSTVVIPGVWRPVHESLGTVYAVPITIGVLATLHTIGVTILMRRRRVSG